MPTDQRPPKPRDILPRAAITPAQAETFRAREAQSLQASLAAEHHIQGLRDFYRARRVWSVFLMACVGGSLIFQVVVTLGVGLKLLSFTEYRWFLPLVVSENFLQILGLAAILLKWIYSGAVPGVGAVRDGEE